MKSTQMPARLNKEIKHRSRVCRISPNTEPSLGLARALCAENRQPTLEDIRYFSMCL